MEKIKPTTLTLNLHTTIVVPHLPSNPSPQKIKFHWLTHPYPKPRQPNQSIHSRVESKPLIPISEPSKPSNPHDRTLSNHCNPTEPDPWIAEPYYIGFDVFGHSILVVLDLHGCSFTVKPYFLIFCLVVTTGLFLYLNVTWTTLLHLPFANKTSLSLALCVNLDRNNKSACC